MMLLKMLKKQKINRTIDQDPMWLVLNGIGRFKVFSSLKMSLLLSTNMKTKINGAERTKQQPNMVR